MYVMKLQMLKNVMQVELQYIFDKTIEERSKYERIHQKLTDIEKDIENMEHNEHKDVEKESRNKAVDNKLEKYVNPQLLTSEFPIQNETDNDIDGNRENNFKESPRKDVDTRNDTPKSTEVNSYVQAPFKKESSKKEDSNNGKKASFWKRRRSSLGSKMGIRIYSETSKKHHDNDNQEREKAIKPYPEIMTPSQKRNPFWRRSSIISKI